MPKIYEGVYNKDALTLDCEKSAPCAGALHHYEECQERLTNGKQLFENEDCTEELYVTELTTAVCLSVLHCVLTIVHIAHCALECTAPYVYGSG